MNVCIPLALVVGVPVIILMALRINATMVFLSLCLGNLLVQFVASDAHSVFELAGKATPSQAYVKLGLLLLPVVLTAVFMIRTVNGPKLLWNVFPAIGFGLVLAFLAVPLLPTYQTATLVNGSIWHLLIRLQMLVVGASTLVCLLYLWTTRPHHGKSKHHGKHAI